MPEHKAKSEIKKIFKDKGKQEKKVKLFSFITLYKEKREDELHYKKKYYLLGIPLVSVRRRDFEKTVKVLGIPFSQHLGVEEILHSQENLKKYWNLKIAELEDKIENLSGKVKVAGKNLKTSREIIFSQGNAEEIIKHGFYRLEKWGAWMREKASVLLLLLNCRHDINIHLTFKKFNPDDNNGKIITIYANGERVISTGDSDVEFVVSNFLIRQNGILQLDFITDGAQSPHEIGISNDMRKLGFGLVRISADSDMIVAGMDCLLGDYLFNYKLSCTFNAEEWKSYLASEDIVTKQSVLERGLDDASTEVVRRLLKRRQNNYEFSAYEDIKHEDVMDLDISKYKIANKHGFQPEVFYFKNGLKFVDDEVIKQYLSGRDVIDGGACSGDSALMFAEYDFVNKIYAFEPIKENYEGLKKTLEINKCDKAEAVHKGLSDSDGTAEILGEDCEIITVDTFAKDKKIGCIKFDLEGMESQALEGCIKTIKRDKPLLMICLYHTPKDFFEIKPRLEALDLGYKFKIVDTEPKNAAVGVHAMLIAY